MTLKWIIYALNKVNFSLLSNSPFSSAHFLTTLACKTIDMHP